MGSAISKLLESQQQSAPAPKPAGSGSSAIGNLIKGIPVVKNTPPPARPKPGADHPFNKNNPNYQQNMDNAMGGATTSFWKNFWSSIPESLPLGVGDIVKQANQMTYEDWQAFDEHTTADWMKFGGEGVKETVKSFVNAPVRIAAQVRATATGGKKDSITLPVLGKSEAYSTNVINDVENGKPMWLSVVEQVPNVIFDTLFTAGAVQKAISPRESTILSGKGKVPLRSNILPNEAMKPRSFRLTQNPKPTYMPITEKTPDGAWIRSKLVESGKLDPNNPTYLKLEATNNGVNGKIVQIKPGLIPELLKGDTGKGPIIRPAKPVKGEIVIEGGELTPKQLREIGINGGQSPTIVPPLPVVSETISPTQPVVTQLPSGKFAIQGPVSEELANQVFPTQDAAEQAVALAKPLSETEVQRTIAEVQTKIDNAATEDERAVFTERSSQLSKALPETTKMTIPKQIHAELLTTMDEIKGDKGIEPEFLSLLSKMEAGNKVDLTPKEVKVLQNELSNAIDKNADDFPALSKYAEKALAKTKTPKLPADTSGFIPKDNIKKIFDTKVTETTEPIVRRSEIAKELSKKLNVPIRRGKFSARGALGIFKHGPKVVRIKKGGLDTVFHEVAHFLDDKFGFSKKMSLDEAKALMEEYGYSYNGQPKKQRGEGFAEFMRFRMTGQEARANRLAPELAKKFDAEMAEMPEIRDVIETAKADFKRWHEQPAVAKILSNISTDLPPAGPMKDRASNFLHTAYTWALDDLHPLSEFSSLAKKKGVKVAADEDPYILARNMRGWVGKANQFLDKGTFGKKFWETDSKGKTKAVFKGKGYTEIMKPISDAGKLDDFRVYIVSQRVLELAKRKIETGISVEDAEAALAELGGKNPEFEKVSEERRKYRTELLEYAKENHVIGPKGLANMQEMNQYYVPFYRVMEEMKTPFMGGKKVAGNTPNPIKKIKGSERDIIDPLESDIKDTYAIINAAERNNVAIAMANMSKMDPELGRLFEMVDKKKQGIKVNVKEVLQQALPPELAAMMPDDLAETVVNIFRPAQVYGENLISVNFGDKSAVFQADPDLFKALQGLNTEDLGFIMKILSLPAKALRAGATLSPDFAIRNPIRDQFSAAVFSDYGYKPGIDLVRGMFELFKKGDTYNLWKMGGGEHSMLVSMDRKNLKNNFEDLMRSSGGKVLEMVKHPIDMLRMISEISEQATRLGEMRRAVAGSKNPVAAAYASREITLDFARTGAKTKGFNSITAFFNAQLQGTDRYFRAAKKNPYRTLFKSLLYITLPSILLYLANRDDERWKEIPTWQKDLFWIVMTDDHIYRIPKPPGIGQLFGTVPERIMEVIDNDDPELFDQMSKDIATGLFPSWIPTGLLPIIENMTNHSFFLNRPIVSRGQEGLPAEAQKNTYTSETASVIGETLDYSPAKVDNLIAGYTGGLGRYATTTVDEVLKGTGLRKSPEPPAKEVEDLPILKAFMIRPPAGSSSESVNRIYDTAAIIDGKKQNAKRIFETGDTEAFQAYLKENPEITYDKLFNKVLANFTEINNARNQLRSSDLSPEEKRVKITELDELQTQIARSILEQIKKPK